MILDKQNTPEATILIAMFKLVHEKKRPISVGEIREKAKQLDECFPLTTKQSGYVLRKLSNSL